MTAPHGAAAQVGHGWGGGVEGGGWRGGWGWFREGKDHRGEQIFSLKVLGGGGFGTLSDWIIESS